MKRARSLNLEKIRNCYLMLLCILPGILWGQSTQIPPIISGIVKNTLGESLTGVNVTLKSEKNKVEVNSLSNEKGIFTFDNVPNGDDYSLTLTIVGYAQRHMSGYKLEKGKQLSVIARLEEAPSELEEVVVVGYGTQRKVNLSGAVDHVSAEVLEDRPISNVAQGLQGMIPNLNIRFNSGAPGASANINIRGITSINGGDPLILIDGVQSTTADLNLVSPQDIENISVIKDASAAAIYGARAAFGVILLTTKFGSNAGAKLQYSNNLTWNSPTVLGDKVTDPYIFSRLLETSTDNTPWDNVNYSDQYYDYARQRSDDPSLSGVRVNPTDPKLWEYMGNRDWARYFLSDLNFTHNHDLSLVGASDNNKLRYYMSGGYNRQNSPITLADDYYDRYSFRTKLSYELFKGVKIANNTMATSTLRKSPSQYSLFDIYNYFPTSYDINPDGSWANSPVGIGAAKMVDGGETTTKLANIQTQFSAEASFLDNALKVNADYTHRYNAENYNSFTTKYKIGYGPNDIREQGGNSATRSALFSYFNVFNIYGTFDKKIDQHAVTAILGYNQEGFREEWFDVSKKGLISSSLPTIGLATGETTGREKINTYALQGAFYRLNYTYKDRYILEFNGRYDGSSRFPKEKRFGFFPSGSMAWRISEETFMDGLRPYLSNLKLRTSYGSLGNQNISNYGYIAMMNTFQSGYLVNGERPFAISTPGLVSPNYTWEEVNTFNLGIDLGLFSERFTATFDTYQRNTLNMLTLGKELPAVLGTSEPSENAADLKTKGWELSLGYKNNSTLAGSPFSFSARFVLSDSKSKITRFDNPSKSILQFYEGMEFGEIWGLQNDGLFASADEIAQLDQNGIVPWGALQIVPGWPKYKDLDANGIIEKGYIVENTKDLRIIGNSTPRYLFGLDVNTNWKNIDFRMFWQGVAKRDYYPIDYLYWGHYQQPYGNTFKHLFDFYRGEADSDSEREKHSQAYLNAGLADQNLNAEYPILQSWLADANLGTRVDNAMGLVIPQTKYLLNASYMRLKNLTIGYSLPVSLVKDLGLSRLRVYVSGENVFEFSQVKKFFDPETTNANIHTNPTQSIGRSGNGMTYPFQRSYSFGVNMVF